jgi:hypothetical protein
MNMHVQDIWATKLPWAESIMGSKGKVVQGQCKVCSLIDGKDKLLVTKFDSPWKHAGHHKTLVALPVVRVGEHYFLKSNARVLNEKLYFAKGSEILLWQVTHGAVQIFDKRKKIVQFALIFHLLNHDYPATKYTTM